jgi:DNA mismatch endonuclease, patch repair protein
VKTDKEPEVTSERSALMRSVRQKNTEPEVETRSILHSLGLRFRLHTVLPGTPDIVLRRHRTVVFVHGCFWHRHDGCARTTSPKTRRAFWKQKFDRNVERDLDKNRALRKLGWRVVIVWECETRNPQKLKKRLGRLFSIRADMSSNS